MDPSKLDRRQLLSYAAFSSVAATAVGRSARDSRTSQISGRGATSDVKGATDRAARKFSMKKSINLWAKTKELEEKAGVISVTAGYSV